jgi:hypothetical protein
MFLQCRELLRWLFGELSALTTCVAGLNCFDKRRSVPRKLPQHGKLK